MSQRHGKKRIPVSVYLLDEPELLITRVTEHSFWPEDVWRFPPDTPGQGTVSLNWRLDCPPTRWGCSEFQNLLNHAKRFLVSIKDNNRSGKNPKGTTLQFLGVALRLLINWMHTNGIFSFSELTVPIYTRYTDFVATMEIDDDGESALLQHRLSGLIGIGGRIFQQSVLFQTLPAMRLERDPLGGQSAHDRAAQLTSHTGDTIPPMPDEVYDPLMAASIKWVRDYATDILALLEIYEHVVAVIRLSGGHLCRRNFRPSTMTKTVCMSENLALSNNCACYLSICSAQQCA